MQLAPAIGTTFDYSIPIEKMLEFIHEAGFDYISLGMHLDHSNYHTTDGRIKLKSLLNKYELKLDSIHANYIHEHADIASLDETLRDQGVADFIEVLQAARDLECGIVIFHAHRHYHDFKKLDQISDSVLRSVEELASHASWFGVKLAVENLYNKGASQILENLFERFSSDELGFCYDSSHDNICSETRFGDVLINHGGRLLATHFSDNMGRDDDHMIPYNAKIDFGLIAKTFSVETYKGNLLLETEVRNHPELADFTPEFLRQTFDAAMQLRKEILAIR